MASLVLKLGQRVPDKPGGFAVGGFIAAIKRGSPDFELLVRNENEDIVFKNEEGNGDDSGIAERLQLSLSGHFS